MIALRWDRLLTVLLALACARGAAAQAPVADTIYVGGTVVTMNDANDVAEAVAVKDGKILLVGTGEAVRSLAGEKTRVVELKGKTLMPGFLDPHSHLFQVAVKLATADLSPPPIGPVDSLAKLKQALLLYKGKNRLKPGQWILGMGYDDTALAEKRHPTREDLDVVSAENPIFLLHISSHLAAMNSKALELARITADTQDPPGGRIRRRAGSREPNGVLEEHAMLLALGAFPKPDPATTSQLLRAALEHYASLGITTAQEGAASTAVIAALRATAAKRRLPVDLVAYPIYLEADKVLGNFARDKVYQNGFRLGGVKFVIDGSLQGYTGYLSQPYYVQPGNTRPTPAACVFDQAQRLLVPAESRALLPAPPPPGENYRGYPAFKEQSELDGLIAHAVKNRWPILAHTNGDGATDQLLTATRKALKEHRWDDHRTTIIHAQTIREDQLDAARGLGMMPSFFPGHVYYWGDRHRDIFLGPARATRISPARSALNRRMRFTLHHDAPVTPVSMFDVAAFAVNRRTTSGKSLGPQQRIGVVEALRAVTIDAAYQYFEEKEKGSIEPGKFADLLIVSQNPLEVDPAKLREIRVLTTIVRDKTVFSEGAKKTAPPLAPEAGADRFDRFDRGIAATSSRGWNRPNAPCPCQNGAALAERLLGLSPDSVR